MDIKELYQLYLQHPQVTTDSRDCPAGSIFIALKGASFDGNKFAKAALDKGCSYAIIDEKEYADPADNRIILVDDCLVTFKELAREHRRQFDIPVIGITGTNGKTTTKELISAVLAEKYRVMHTEGNFNNDVGVPKTLLRLAPEHEIAVVEMGASHPGDIQQLVDYVEPTCGLITNVGRAHLQGFGSFEGVKKTKGELYDFLKSHGALCFLNTSNEHLVQMANDRELERIISYGEDEQAQVQGEVVSCAPFLKLRWGAALSSLPSPIADMEVLTHLIGAYNIDNVLAAITVGLYFGVSAEQICHALEHYVPSNNRSQLEKTDNNWLIIDAYNANPTSMSAAIDNFERIEVSHPKMAILGDMRELGDVSVEEHQKIVDLLKTSGFDQIWLVGEEFGKTDTALRRFKDVEEVKDAIAQEHPDGYYILIKGSNGIHLAQLCELL
ncbi:MAG: UDP-N-acetylmuramoyl-tripeptide--D-alanyl-D-alanine ligase [Prevotella sp.]|nr:UDP-N-acetylmuramoyl-tripeptide--D-alanyl-D-alanine ligase [Prevotella sp.]